VWVVDDREQYCNSARFPFAKCLQVGPLDESLKELRVDEQTFCIIVTRGHHHDEEALSLLARRPSRFLGMIGSRRKIRLIFDDLLREGIPRDDLRRVHAPLGLEIGSQTVPEIAVSIVAELIAHRNLADVPPPLCRPSILEELPVAAVPGDRPC
jgi:xanthine dehydrogenase accessory factor